MKQLYNKVSVIMFAIFFLTFNVSAQTWQSTIPVVSGGTAQLQDIATDAADNIYSTGYFTTNISSPVSLTGSAADNTFLLRADATGTVTFSKKISGPSVKGYRVAVDEIGRAHV